MIIDAHAHIFPEKIAQKAALSIGEFYEIPMCYDGTVQTLLAQGKANGIDRFLVHSVATVPAQVESINRFIAAEVAAHPKELIGFAAMHPDCEDIPRLVDEAAAMGLCGIKLHPDFQRFVIDSPRAMRIYEAAQGRMPVLIHTGDYRYGYSHPKRLARVLELFPKLDVIAAHFGGWSQWKESARYLGGKRVYVDTSSSLYAISRQEARALIDLFGTERVLFGTDYPMWDIGEERARFEALDLTASEREAICHGNLERLLQRGE